MEKQWWIATFDCKQVSVPEEWDFPLPSDVALRLPGSDEPAILLCDREEVRRAGYDRPNEHSVIFCSNLIKGLDFLRSRGTDANPIQQDGGGTEFFEVRDPEGNIIEICKEP